MREKVYYCFRRRVRRQCRPGPQAQQTAFCTARINQHNKQLETLVVAIQNETMPSSSPPIVIRYHHLAVVCTDLDVSRKFYELIGFEEKPETTATSSSCILVNVGGLELHLLKTGRRNEDNKNILMDVPDEKFPGHTHMSFGVGSVPEVVAYFEKLQIPLSGTRNIPGIAGPVSIFVRDPDRTVVEFERNDGGDDGLAVTPQSLSSAPRGGVDHIGTRVSNPKVALEWYMQKLGFGHEAMMYEMDEDSKKNFRPWIVRTQHERPPYGDVDINLIINATTTGENVLLSTTGQDPLPGILYAAYVVESVEAAIQSINPADIAKTEDELKAWGIIASEYVLPVGGTKSCFIRDLDQSIYRLLEL
jgi:catechol 2,3-dioxygenase-like lactoylglutathione lyase family enzyme